MKVIVVGGGVIGVTTAYFLSRAGHRVTVIEREAGPGRQTSFANGTLLTPSMPEPWNAPGCWRVLLASIGRSDTALKLRLRAVPSLTRWGITFLRNSRRQAFEYNALRNLRLALHSMKAMETVRVETNIEYGRTSVGTLRVFRTPESLEQAAQSAERFKPLGLNVRRLDPWEAIQLEPALAPIVGQLAGVLHHPDDETGDAYRFCENLTSAARVRGVEFRFGVAVSRLEVQAGKVVALVTAHEKLSADYYVLAAGSFTAPLLRQIGVYLPVRPAKGYSLTIDRGGPGETPVRFPIIDDDWHAAVVPLGRSIRIAGTAEFAGFDCTIDPRRIDNLVTVLRQVLPNMAFDPGTAQAWCGLRPMSADGVPIIGGTEIANLWVNVGHGHLGWTLAAGSAQVLADSITRARAELDLEPYSLRRFTAQGPIR